MATWGVHLRVARLFIECIDAKHHREFVIGSVAPDCGYGEKDSFGDFVPPPTVTHWSPSGIKRDCRHKDFCDKYLTEKKNDDYWFYLGYYVHLLTDIMWSSVMYMPTRIKYAKEYEVNHDFLKVIKKDWNDIDALHLKSLNEAKALDILKNAGDIKDYLDYYEKGQLTKQVKVIAEHYENYKGNPNRDFEYTKPVEIDTFVNAAYELLNMVLKKKELI